MSADGNSEIANNYRQHDKIAACLRVPRAIPPSCFRSAVSTSLCGVAVTCTHETAVRIGGKVSVVLHLCYTVVTVGFIYLYI